MNTNKNLQDDVTRIMNNDTIMNDFGHKERANEEFKKAVTSIELDGETYKPYKGKLIIDEPFKGYIKKVIEEILGKFDDLINTINRKLGINDD